MPATYEPIATQTLGSNTGTVTFSSIPGTYTDLVIISNPIATTNGIGIRLQFNGDTGSNYSRSVLSGFGTTSGTADSINTFTNQTSIGSNWQVGGGTGGPSPHIHNINNYSNSTTNKTVLFRTNAYPYSGNSEVTAEVGLWRNTAAITSITMTGSTGDFATGSTFSLYGIKAA